MKIQTRSHTGGRKIRAVTAVLAAVGLLTACGKSPEEMKYVSDLKVKDYVILANYDTVEVELEAPQVSDEYLDAYITFLMMGSQTYEPVSGRGVEQGDQVNLDFQGKIDGEAFEGGTASGYDLVIGSGSFIEGFEDGMVGMEIGETRDLDLKFPDPYKGNPELSGTPVVFTVTVNSISEPVEVELTDEYVAGLNMEEYKTVEEYKEYVRDRLMEQAQAGYEQEKVDASLAAMREKSVFEELPTGMVDRLYTTLMDNAKAYAEMSGMEAGDYVAAAYGGEAEDYEDTLREEALRMAQENIMASALADKEKITVTDEELKENLGGRSVDEEAYREFLLTQKVGEFLAERAVVSEPGAR